MRAFILFLIAIILFVLISPFAFVIQLIINIKQLSNYLFTVAIGLDQLGGSILYKTENWTVSSYTYLLCNKGSNAACVFMKLIDRFFGKEHCKKSFFSEANEDYEEFKKIKKEIYG